MSEISELILLLNKQHQEQMTVLRDEHREQNKQHQEQMAVLRDEQNKQHQEQMTMLQEQLKTLQSSLNNPRENVPTPMASFQPFNSTSELWSVSQTLFGNPKGPVELGNPNTCAETKLCLNFILFRLKK